MSNTATLFLRETQENKRILRGEKRIGKLHFLLTNSHFYFVCAQPVENPNKGIGSYAATILFLPNNGFVGTKKKKKKKRCTSVLMIFWSASRGQLNNNKKKNRTRERKLTTSKKKKKKKKKKDTCQPTMINLNEMPNFQQKKREKKKQKGGKTNDINGGSV